MWSLLLAFMHSIVLCLNGGSPSPVILALQRGEQVVPIDTLSPDHLGCVRFLGDSPLEPGQYLFVQDNRRLFNFLISSATKTDMSFTAHISNGRTVEIMAEGSEENSAYIRFYRFLQERYAQANDILEQETDPEKAMQDVERLESTIREYTGFIAEQYEGCMLGIIAKNIFTPVLAQENASLHYLDNVDFTEERILNTSILPLRLNEYFLKVLPPVPDTLIFHADRILGGKIHPLVKEYVARYLFTLFFTSDIMGMESVAVHLADRWFLTDALLQQEKDLLEEMATFVRFNKQCLLGMKAPELDLPDVWGQVRPLDQIKARFTVIVFFEDNCPVCSDELLKLIRYHEEHRDNGVQFYAVYTQDNREVMSRYASFFPKEWITVWDPDFSSGFHEKYNVRSTPRIYLLDKEKKIIGRDLGTETLERLIRDHAAEEEIVLKKAPDIMLETENKASFSLYDVEATYTILYFYDPACSVCGFTTAGLYDLFLKARDKGLMVFAVYTGHDYVSWRKWIGEGDFTDWINVWNPSSDDRISKYYNVNDPPLILLLDKEKHVVADQLSLEALSYIVNELMPVAL